MSIPEAAQRVIIDGDLEIATKPGTTGNTLGRLVFTDKTLGDIGSVKVYGFSSSTFRLINDSSKIGRGASFRTFSSQGGFDEGGTGALYTMDIQNGYIRFGNYSFITPQNYRYPTGDFPSYLFKVEKEQATTGSYAFIDDIQAWFNMRYFLQNQSLTINVGAQSGSGLSMGYRGGATIPYGFLGLSNNSIHTVTEYLKLLPGGTVEILSTLKATTVDATNWIGLPSPDFLPITLDKTNNRVGINNSLPTVDLDVYGTTNSSAYTLSGLPTIVYPTGGGVSIGPTIGASGLGSLSIGNSAGLTTQGNYSTAVGTQAGYSNQGTNAVAVGFDAGKTSQLTSAVAVGYRAGTTTQGINSTAIGSNAGNFNQATQAVAIGATAGQTSQGSEAIAIGVQSGNSSQSNGAVSIGYYSGNTTQGLAAISIGSSAGRTNQGGYSVAIGPNCGRTNQASFNVAIGHSAGNDTQAQYSIAIGSESGTTLQGTNSVAVGNQAGNSNQGARSVAIGNNAAKITQSFDSVAIGNLSGQNTQSQYCVSVGSGSGTTTQGFNSTAIGFNSGNNLQGIRSTAIGSASGQTSQGRNAVAVGYNAGNANQGIASIAIGSQAGETSQHANTIILNASDSPLNSTVANSLYINPIRNTTSAPPNVLTYDTTTKEVTYAPPTFANSVFKTVNAAAYSSPLLTGYTEILSITPGITGYVRVHATAKITKNNNFSPTLGIYLNSSATLIAQILLSQTTGTTFYQSVDLTNTKITSTDVIRLYLYYSSGMTANTISIPAGEAVLTYQVI